MKNEWKEKLNIFPRSCSSYICYHINYMTSMNSFTRQNVFEVFNSDKKTIFLSDITVSVINTNTSIFIIIGKV